MADAPWLVLVESNTTGSGREFCVAARTRGLRPVVLAKDPQRYPYLEHDRIDHVGADTNDPAAVLRACADLGAGGVAGVTSSSEFFISIAAAAAIDLGLPAPDPRAVTACRDKHRQHQLLSDAGVGVPRSLLATSVDEAVAAARSIRLPTVVKPTTGSGSLGVRLCATLDEVARSAAGLLEAGVDARVSSEGAPVLVEEYVTGPEYSVETFDKHVVGITAKHLGPEPFFVETGHDFPAPLGEHARSLLADTVLGSLTSLGLGWGPAHTELRVGPHHPVVIEVNPRLAGGMIPAVVRAATGVDLIDCVVAAATGSPVSITPTRADAAAIRFLVATRAGRVAAADGLDEAAMLPGVHAIALTVAEGETVPSITNSFRDRIGYAIATGPDADSAVRAVEAAVRRVSVRIE